MYEFYMKIKLTQTSHSFIIKFNFYLCVICPKVLRSFMRLIQFIYVISKLIINALTIKLKEEFD